ncbi:hypothetical protein GCM10007147_18020 [Nocardiopsis kunsanensis]|uniref:CYTH domain-containing protein n=1 Tax=Nocardiopsis kunsanensis TaxID=141693 RepID=A0A918XBY6_9ACTN|nr:class IV adenylate cyclase [Nocardiopsis kunsanensis]GHD23178.1 hypothetical protein GCM10007147_18020 [Nocardiopsis kunsanensis]
MTLVEIERKRALDTRSAELLLARLGELGFTATRPAREVDTYYSRPDVDFMETVECLRVRQGPVRCEITYKPASDQSTHSADGTIAKQETNVALADPDQGGPAHQFLGALGMVLLAEVDKSRVSYRHPDDAELAVVVDTVAGLGTFVETEVLSSRSHTQALAQLTETERLLGLQDCPVVCQPYRDLVMENSVRGSTGNHSAARGGP